MKNAEDLLREYFVRENISYTEIPRSKIKGKKTPDFEACVSGRKVIIEAKDFEYGESDASFSRGHGFFTAPQPPGMNKIRTKLQECSDQFKGYQSEITLCILCNAKKILVDLDTVIVGMAMFGNIDIHLPVGSNNPTRFEYGKDGSRQISRKAGGSLISAVAVLEKKMPQNSKESYWRLRIIHNHYSRTPLPLRTFNSRLDEEWICENDGSIRKVPCK